MPASVAPEPVAPEPTPDAPTDADAPFDGLSRSLVDLRTSSFRLAEASVEAGLAFWSMVLNPPRDRG